METKYQTDSRFAKRLSNITCRHGSNGNSPVITPLIGGLDADKFLYESLTKRGRAIRRNRNRAKGWKIYQSYVPTRQDSILFPRISKVSEQDSLPKQDTLLIKKDSAIINQNSLLLKDKINGKDQTEKAAKWFHFSSVLNAQTEIM